MQLKLVLTSLLLLLACSLFAQRDTAQRLNIHFQTTYIYQYKPAFTSPYEGPNSLKADEEHQNSLTATLFAGLRLWKGAAIYINPEIAGGSGLSGAYGLSTSTNGETFRVGDPSPTLYLARGYFQQTFSLDNNDGWTKQINALDDKPNQLDGVEPKNYFRVMLGKFSLGDIFDNNPYSNSPRTQFLNWSLMNNAAWDYAANLRGYTYSLAAIVQSGNMTYKVALATLPTVANGQDLNTDLSQEYSLNAEIMEAHTIHDMPGHVRLLGYYNNGDMGNYKKALQMADTPNHPPDVISTRAFGNTKVGFGLCIDQQVEDNIGFFFRYGMNDGLNETWCFTEADRTFSLGMNINGAEWKRDDDNLGVAFVVNGLSKDHKNYLKAGGLGFQLGDGQLSYAGEAAIEAYYSFKVPDKNIWFSGDYQLVLDPGYNKDRGPVNVLSLRVHVEL